MKERIKSKNKQLNILKYLLPLIFLIYFKHSFSQLAAWREDEAVTLWLALVNNLFDSPFVYNPFLLYSCPKIIFDISFETDKLSKL